MNKEWWGKPHPTTKCFYTKLSIFALPAGIKPGDYDIVICDPDFDHRTQQVHYVYVYENTGSKLYRSWSKSSISGDSNASHK
jgi:hypothetical protein